METKPPNLRLFPSTIGNTFYSLYSIYTIYILHRLALGHTSLLQYTLLVWGLKMRMLHLLRKGSPDMKKQSYNKPFSMLDILNLESQFTHQIFKCPIIVPNHFSQFIFYLFNLFHGLQFQIGILKLFNQVFLYLIQTFGLSLRYMLEQEFLGVSAISKATWTKGNNARRKRREISATKGK